MIDDTVLMINENLYDDDDVDNIEGGGEIVESGVGAGALSLLLSYYLVTVAHRYAAPPSLSTRCHNVYCQMMALSQVAASYI